jgi:Tfp pilus assembly protein PilO
LKKRAEKLKSKENNLLSIDYKYFQDNFVKTTQVLPESKDYVSLFTTLDNLERKVGVSLRRTDFQLGVISTASSRLVKSTVSSAYIIPLTIEVIGNLSSLQNFISSLSDYTGRFMTVDEIQWRPEVGSAFSLILNGKAYFYPLQNTLGSIDSPLPKISSNEENILAKIAKIKIEEEADIDLDKGSIGKKDLFQ